MNGNYIDQQLNALYQAEKQAEAARMRLVNTPSRRRPLYWPLAALFTALIALF